MYYQIISRSLIICLSMGYSMVGFTNSAMIKPNGNFQKQLCGTDKVKNVKICLGQDVSTGVPEHLNINRELVHVSELLTPSAPGNPPRMRRTPEYFIVVKKDITPSTWTIAIQGKRKVGSAVMNTNSTIRFKLRGKNKDVITLDGTGNIPGYGKLKAVMDEKFASPGSNPAGNNAEDDARAIYNVRCENIDGVEENRVDFNFQPANVSESTAVYFDNDTETSAKFVNVRLLETTPHKVVYTYTGNVSDSNSRIKIVLTKVKSHPEKMSVAVTISQDNEADILLESNSCFYSNR